MVSHALYRVSGRFMHAVMNQTGGRALCLLSVFTCKHRVSHPFGGARPPEGGEGRLLMVPARTARMHDKVVHAL